MKGHLQAAQALQDQTQKVGCYGLYHLQHYMQHHTSRSITRNQRMSRENG